MASGEVARRPSQPPTGASAAHVAGITRTELDALAASVVSASTLSALSRMADLSSAAATAQALRSGLAAQTGTHLDGVAARLAATWPRFAGAEQLAAAAAPMAAVSGVLARAGAAQLALGDALAPAIARQQALMGQVLRSSGVTALGLHPKGAVLPELRIGPEVGQGRAVRVWAVPDPLRFRARVQDRVGRKLVAALERVGLGDVADLLVGGWENLERRTPGAVSFAAHAAVEVIDRTLKLVAPEEGVRAWLVGAGRRSPDDSRWTGIGERLEYTAWLLGGLLGDELLSLERALVQRRRLGQDGKHASTGTPEAAARLLRLAEMLVEIVFVDGRGGPLDEVMPPIGGEAHVERSGA